MKLLKFILMYSRSCALPLVPHFSQENLPDQHIRTTLTGFSKTGVCQYSWFALCILLLAACNPGGRKDIRDYYFPIRQLTEGLVYEYRAVGQDSISPAYWYYRSFIQDEGIYLTGTYYEYDLNPLQLVREELVSNGMLLQDLYLYVPDSTGRNQRLAAEVLSGNVFPFSVSDSSGIFLYKVRFEFPNEIESTTTLIKNRRYLGDTTYTYQGDTYPAVRFGVRELVEDNSLTEGSIEPRFNGEEIYAKGIGLVYYWKNLGGQKLVYRLADRYPMEQLEKKASERLNQTEQ